MRTSENTRKIVSRFFEHVGGSAEADTIASLFNDEVDWKVPGDEHIPWVGRKTGRVGVVAFIRDLRKFTTPIRVSIRTLIVEGENAVGLLDLETRITSTGKTIRTEAAFAFTVRDDLIVRFRLFEDSYAVSQAYFA